MKNNGTLKVITPSEREIMLTVSAGRRNDAVKLFFAKAIGIPDFGVNLMRFQMPGWSRMAGMAHPIPYDIAVLAGTQNGQTFAGQTMDHYHRADPRSTVRSTAPATPPF